MIKLKFMKFRVHALNYENPQSYKISDILGKMDRSYLDYISKMTEQITRQKTLAKISYTKDPESARKILGDGNQFDFRFNSLSKEAKEFYWVLYASGRVWKRENIPVNESKSTLKPEVHECLDKLVVFGLPSRENPEIIIIPVDYAILHDFRSGSSSLSLVDALKSYSVTLLNKIAKDYNLRTSDSKTAVTIETYSTIVKNLERTLQNLSPTENRIMDYLMANDGILGFEELTDHFKIKNKNAYYNRVDFGNLFSPGAYSGGEQFISLLKKGLVYCSKRMYYSSIDTVYLPDEVIMKLREIRVKKVKSPESRRKESESIYSILKNYAVDYAAEMKATFLAIYYLETRGKKRSSEFIGKFVSMPEEDLDMVLEHSKIEGWLKGGTSNMAITPDGLKFIEERNFASRLKQHVYDEHIFSAWKATGELRHIFLDNLRMLFLDAIYHMQYPEKLEDLSAEVKSGDNYFKLSRSLRIALMQDDMFISNSGSLVFMKQNMENEMSMWILELISFLSIYGLVRMSSPVMASDVYIFPEQEFIEVYDKKGDIRYEDDKRSEQKPVKVLPNNDILVGIGADFTDLKKVADFSELVSADLVCTFRITKASLSAYLNKSGKITEVISFLKKKSSVPVPDTVLRLISDMEKKVDEVRVTKCQAVLQVDDRTVIDGIMNITGIADMIEKRISPEILAIKEGVSLYKFVTELRKKGYIVPIKVEKEKKSRRPAWYSW
jgi:hypothetical protein